MKNKHFEKFIEIAGLLVVCVLSFGLYALLLGLPVYMIWNWVPVQVFNFPALNFWESIGLTYLCRCLFYSEQKRAK